MNWLRLSKAWLRSWLATTLVVLASLSVSLNSAAATPLLSARVVGVIDGDTVSVLTASRQLVRVRLVEIDAPEHNQPWGSRAKQALSTRVFGREVQIEDHGRDRYGRLLGRIFVDHHDVNADMISSGSAWAYRAYLTDHRLIAVELQARAARLGLWSLPSTETVPPWDWRRGVRHGGQEMRALVLPARAQSVPAGTSFVGQAAPSASFRCGAKRYCTQMTSCSEARFYLSQCGLSRLDGDGDGRPCESLCR